MYAHTLLRLLMACIIMLTASAGCTRQPDPPAAPPFTFITTNDLFTVASLDSGHVWVAGFDGCIYHSPNGGSTWLPQKSPLNHSLCDISFVSPTTGWISGRAGTMLHTRDGGANWVAQPTGSTSHLFGLSFINERQGWAVGDFGAILHTSDGGLTWQDQGTGEDRIHNDVFFVSPTHGWVVGEYGFILHTRDGGLTWQEQECEDIIPVYDETEWESFPPSLYSVYFADTHLGWITGMDGTVLTTTNGGELWTKLSNPAENSRVTLYGVHYNGTDLCIIGQKGTSLHSGNHGRLWLDSTDQTGTRFWLRALSLNTNRTGFAVGSRGTILQTLDGGETWSMLSGIPLLLGNDDN